MSERKKGIVCIICAAFFFSLMTLFVRLSGDLPTMEKAFFRNFVAIFFSGAILLKKKISVKCLKGNVFPVLMRAICGTLGLICNFYAIDRLNISDANMLNKLSPFFAMIMSVFLLKEMPKKFEWLTLVIAFIGAVLVIKPGFSFTSAYAFVGLLGGMGAGVAYSFVRLAGKRGVKGPVIVLFFSVFSSLVTLPLMLAQYKPMSATQLVILLLAGASATGGQMFITAAYTHAPAKEISVFDYTQVLFAAFWGFLVFDQIPDVYSIIGYVVIIGAVVMRYIYNLKLAE